MPAQTNNQGKKQNRKASRKWSAYNEELKRRSAFLLLFDPSMVSRPNYAGIGRLKLYEDKFYGYLYILMHLYDLTYRGLEGFLYCIAPFKYCRYTEFYNNL